MRTGRPRTLTYRTQQIGQSMNYTDIILEFDLDDLRRLHRLVEMGASADVIDPDNERVLAFVAFQLALAEKAAQ